MRDMQRARMQSTSAPRLDYIEGLRGIAVLGVLVAHASIWSGFTAAAWGTPMAVALDLGTAGVDLFFVISGFCMLWPRLGDEGVRPLDARRFYAGRVKRIWPPYVVAVLLAIAASWVMWRFGVANYWGGAPGGMQSLFPSTPSDFWANVLSHLTFTHGLTSSYGRGIDGAFWSLSTEWQFYVLLPVVVWAARRFGLVKTLAVAFGVSLLSALPLLGQGTGWLPTNVTDPILHRMVEFASGMAVAAVVRAGRRIPGILVLAPVFIIAALLVQAAGGSGMLAALWSVGFGAILYIGARGGLVGRLGNLRPVRWMGRVSYSVYLLHGTVFMLTAVVTGRLGLGTSARLVIFVTVSIPVAFLAARAMHALVEIPSMRWSHGRRRVESQSRPCAEPLRAEAPESKPVRQPASAL